MARRSRHSIWLPQRCHSCHRKRRRFDPKLRQPNRTPTRCRTLFASQVHRDRSAMHGIDRHRCPPRSSPYGLARTFLKRSSPKPSVTWPFRPAGGTVRPHQDRRCLHAKPWFCHTLFTYRIANRRPHDTAARHGVDFTGMRALRELDAWGWIRRSLHALRQTWRETDDCSAPNCEERAMHFPPSRFCRMHLGRVPS
jgi:hypothetical protein